MLFGAASFLLEESWIRLQKEGGSKPVSMNQIGTTYRLGVGNQLHHRKGGCAGQENRILFPTMNAIMPIFRK